MKSDLSSCLFPNQPLAQQQLSLRRMRDFISLVLSYPMKRVDKYVLKKWINEVNFNFHLLAHAYSCHIELVEYYGISRIEQLLSENPIRYMKGLIPDDILHEVIHGLRPIFNDDEPRKPKELSASTSSSGVAELTDVIDVIPQAIVNLAIDLAVEQLIQTLLSSGYIHHVRLSTRNNAEKRIVIEKIESALKKEDNMLGINHAFQRVLHIDTSKYTSDEEVKVQQEIAKQMELTETIEDKTKCEHVFLKECIEEQMMNKNHLVFLVDGDGDTKIDPQKLGFPKIGIVGIVVLITTESSTQQNDELTWTMDLEIRTKDHLLPWELFSRNVGGELIHLSDVIQKLAVQIVSGCGGHLLALVLVAKSLKNVEDVELWELALDQLRGKNSFSDHRSTHPINTSTSVMVNAFKNFCWHNLKMTQKHCLARCLFIPEVKDGKLDQQLMNDWISSLLVESEEEAENNLRELVDRFIFLQFEENGGRYVKLPTESYDILHSLHTLSPSFIVEDGLELTEPPNTELWHQVVKIQLADNKLSELPTSPNCQELKVLMLQGNHGLTKMPLDFFVHMPVLHILDLSYTSVKDLPSSFFDLEQIKELYLKGCQRFMKLPREIGKLKKLEKLDLDETEIIHLPKEIQNLTNLNSLTLCFYEYHGKRGMQYSCPTIIPSGVISKLKKLKHLSIDVHPDDERWHDNLQVILSEIMGLKCLQTLSLYIPEVELLRLIPADIFKLDFRFVVGHHMKRIMSGTMPTFEAKFKQSECSLKFVKGREVPYEIKKVLGFSKGLFLDRHMTIHSLSEFGMENLEQLRLCILAECKEMQTIVDGRLSNGSKDILSHLLHLSASYMKNLQSICEGPTLSPFVFGMLKSLSLHACPKLTTIFTLNFLRNLSLLKELIVNDCPKVSTLISHESSELESQIFLPRLRKVFLLYLPELINISNGMHIGPTLEIMAFYYCPKLQRLSKTELSSKNLMSIKGETSWWESLKWSEVEWGKAGRPSKINAIFSSINEEADIVSQLGMCNNDEMDDNSGETASEQSQSTRVTIQKPKSLSLVENSHSGYCERDYDDQLKDSINIQVSTGRGVVHNDGYKWRKYADKGWRSHYECAHKGCDARKRVQRSTKDPPTFDITYHGKQTCIEASTAEPAPSFDMGYTHDNSVVTENIYVKFSVSEYTNDNIDERKVAGTSSQSSCITDSSLVGIQKASAKLHKEVVQAKEELDDGYAWRKHGQKKNPRVKRLRKPPEKVVVQGKLDDGYAWRKYGQKEILGAKYPSVYYKCTSKGCSARKKVQRSDEDPPLVEITYNGKHTCSQSQASDVVSPARLKPAALEGSQVMENIYDDSVVNEKIFCDDLIISEENSPEIDDPILS